VPKFAANQGHVGAATASARDPRILHYWDGGGLELTAFRAPLGITSDAWDVYLLYPPGVRWEGATPPAPAFWMHQLQALSSSAIPSLDGAVFAARAHALLGGVKD
jgi:hypothetical protein